jgi:hypothetical protein
MRAAAAAAKGISSRTLTTQLGAARRTACLLAVSSALLVLGCGELTESGLTSDEARRAVAADLCPGEPERVLRELIVVHDTNQWHVYYRASDDVKGPENLNNTTDFLAVFSPQTRSTDGVIVVVPSSDESEAFREQTRADCPD